MRLFLAIELPEEVRRHLDGVVRALKNPSDVSESVSWVKRENWHVTLKFLGEVKGERVGEVRAALTGVQVEKMRLFADRMLYFPKRGPVRVITAGVGGDAGRLNQLHGRIEDVLEPIGFEREQRDFWAHITLGRSRSGERGSGLVSLRKVELAEVFPGPAFDSDSFVLMYSRLSPQGSVYTALARFPEK